MVCLRPKPCSAHLLCLPLALLRAAGQLRGSRQPSILHLGGRLAFLSLPRRRLPAVALSAGAAIIMLLGLRHVGVGDVRPKSGSEARATWSRSHPWGCKIRRSHGDHSSLFFSYPVQLPNPLQLASTAPSCPPGLWQGCGASEGDSSVTACVPDA